MIFWYMLPVANKFANQVIAGVQSRLPFLGPAVCGKGAREGGRQGRQGGGRGEEVNSLHAGLSGGKKEVAETNKKKREQNLEAKL